MISQHTIARDDSIYQAFPDIALTRSEKLVCVYAEMTHHGNRDYTRVMLTDSDDRGRTWTEPRALSKPTSFENDPLDWYNCPRISTLRDGRLAALVDYCVTYKPGTPESLVEGRTQHLFISEDEGATWAGPTELDIRGIVPDQITELKTGDHAGRWIFATHHKALPDRETWRVEAWISDDQGATWNEPITIAEQPPLQLCEPTIVELPEGQLACFMRENTGDGQDCHKCVSTDGGRTWTDPVRFPIPACHRPVAAVLKSGHLLITFRLMQGGQGWVGWWTQNFMGALTDVDSALAETRGEAHTRIFPIAYDRNVESDLGYSGHVQFDDGEIYVATYLLDDAPKAQIRGYSFREEDLLITPTHA